MQLCKLFKLQEENTRVCLPAMHYYWRLSLINAGSHHMTMECSQTERLGASMVRPRGVLIMFNKSVLLSLWRFDSSRIKTKENVIILARMHFPFT